ncbi:MAG: hypothetical protein M1826_001043 [Phylliscum demangeonii]|nr:MAG: hypothetical protein M1826_001043 [Phylliscum demangeonii]
MPRLSAITSTISARSLHLNANANANRHQANYASYVTRHQHRPQSAIHHHPRPLLVMELKQEQTLSAENAAALDRDLMDNSAFSLDQLMELAGLAVSQAGGDGLVAARHLWHYGFAPTIYYPKPGRNELFQRLVTQLKDLDIPFTDDFPRALTHTDHVVDAIFGFSFSGDVRPPFAAVIEAMRDSAVAVTAVDAPSSWDIERGPPDAGPGCGYHPAALVSLTAPKPLVKWFKGRHFVGGRAERLTKDVVEHAVGYGSFLSPLLARKYNLDLPAYEGVDQIVEVHPS